AYITTLLVGIFAPPLMPFYYFIRFEYGKFQQQKVNFFLFHILAQILHFNYPLQLCLTLCPF
ncbi:hypothetical protein, partial [Gemmiger formicilis]|uniref:hypothetical protein n=1 Tax=Gemmiger formicilis TaxID=745368 RepID=UPI002431BD59